MTTDLDDAGDRTWDQRKDERLAVGGMVRPPNLGSDSIGPFLLSHGGYVPLRPRCEGCGMRCDAADFEQWEGHGPDCPEGDPACELRVCSGWWTSRHADCETQADRDTRDAVAREQALRDEETDRVIAERREGVDR